MSINKTDRNNSNGDVISILPRTLTGKTIFGQNPLNFANSSQIAIDKQKLGIEPLEETDGGLSWHFRSAASHNSDFPSRSDFLR
jgi:hypothetical protein